MRLNFSGVNDAEIREGIARIGRVIREQVELYETLAPGPAEAPSVAAPRPTEEDESAEASNVVQLRKAGGANA
jgi:2-aminoadipate transaminase